MAFIKNVVITFGTRCLNFLFAIVTSVVIARVLGPHGRGALALCILLPTMLAVFGGLGISRAFIYYNGKGYYQCSSLIGTTITIIACLSVLLVGAGYFIILFLGDSLFHDIPKIYLFICLFIVPLNLLHSHLIQAILLSFEKIVLFNLIALIEIIAKLILCLIFLLFFKLGIIGALSAVMLASFLTRIISLLVMIGFGYIPAGLHFDKKIVKSLLAFGYRVHLGSVLGFFHLRVDTFILGFLLGPMAVGYYVVSVSIVEKLWLISHVVSDLFYPKLAKIENEEDKTIFTARVARNVLAITVIGACLLFIFSKWLIILLFTEAYLPSVNSVRILLIGIIAVSLDRVLGNDLIARNRGLLNSCILAISLLLNIILNIVFIPAFGLVGAAWATSVSYGISSLLKLTAFCKLSGCSVVNAVLMRKSDFYGYARLISQIRK